MNQDRQKRIDLIRDLTTARGPSGFEDEVLAVARSYAAPFAEIRENSIRNLYLHRKANTGGKPVLMLDAHSDEVGFMIQSIQDNGTLAFLELGRLSPQSFTGQRVWVRNAKGEYIQGVIASKPPHFSKREEAPDELVVDIGASSRQEAVERFHIRIGEPGVAAVDFHYDDRNDLIFAKGLDCRIGCSVLLSVMDRIQGDNLQVDVVGALSSQEEVGDRGALVAAQTIGPAVAIVLEGAPADDTIVPAALSQTALRKGPMLRFMDVSMISNPRFTRFALDLAQREGIPAQGSVRAGGGTNGGCIHTYGDSVPVIVVSVPVRYIHSPNGISTLFDFDKTVDLVAAIIRELDESLISSF